MDSDARSLEADQFQIVPTRCLMVRGRVLSHAKPIGGLFRRQSPRQQPKCVEHPATPSGGPATDLPPTSNSPPVISSRGDTAQEVGLSTAPHRVRRCEDLLVVNMKIDLAEATRRRPGASCSSFLSNDCLAPDMFATCFHPLEALEEPPLCAGRRSQARIVIAVRGSIR